MLRRQKALSMGIPRREDAMKTESPTKTRITRSDAEWRALLTPEQYDVLRRHGTERPGSCALNHEKRAGVFHCVGCGQALFRSREKFESGTGWPSFFDPMDGAVETSRDTSPGAWSAPRCIAAVRRPSRPCLRRWSAAHPSALLHQRRRAGVQAGLNSGLRVEEKRQNNKAGAAADRGSSDSAQKTLLSAAKG